MRVLPLMQRAGWGVADQALSSLTNFALGIVIARSVRPADFGAFALVYAAYVLALGFSRALASEPLVVRYSASSRADWRDAVSRAAGAGILLGAVLGVGFIAVGLFAGGVGGTGLLVLGACLPGLLLQDCWRFAFFSSHRGRGAFLNDLVWALALLAAVLFLLLTDAVTVGSTLAAWGGAAGLAALFGLLQLRILPSPHRIMSWWRPHRDLIPRFAVEVAAHTGAWQVVIYGIGAVAGLAALGAFRAGEILFGPLQVVAVGIGIVAVPELVRLYRASSTTGPTMVLRGAIAVAAVCAAGAFACGATILLLPERAGVALLGAIWIPARELAPALAVMWAGTGTILGAFVGLRALAAARRSLHARIAAACLSTFGGVLGAHMGAAGGAAIGLALGVWLGAGVWWWHFLTELRSATRAASIPTAEVATTTSAV